MALVRAAIVAALFLFGLTFGAVAQDVTLTSRDGEVEISGDLMGFDGEFYRVDTIYGELTVDGSGVLCEGPGCPNLNNYVAEVTLSGAPHYRTRFDAGVDRGLCLASGFGTEPRKSVRNPVRVYTD